MVFNVKKIQHDLLMNPVVFFVDHLALKFMVNKPNLSNWVARWVLFLEVLDYTVEYKPCHLHKEADHPSSLFE